MKKTYSSPQTATLSIGSLVLQSTFSAPTYHGELSSRKRNRSWDDEDEEDDYYEDDYQEEGLQH